MKLTEELTENVEQSKEKIGELLVRHSALTRLQLEDFEEKREHPAPLGLVKSVDQLGANRGELEADHQVGQALGVLGRPRAVHGAPAARRARNRSYWARSGAGMMIDGTTASSGFARAFTAT